MLTSMQYSILECFILSAALAELEAQVNVRSGHRLSTTQCPWISLLQHIFLRISVLGYNPEPIRRKTPSIPRTNCSIQ